MTHTTKIRGLNMKRNEVMKSQGVHNLTKDVLKLSEGKDVVDRYYDVKLALEVLRDEMETTLGLYQDINLSNPEYRTCNIPLRLNH